MAVSGATGCITDSEAHLVSRMSRRLTSIDWSDAIYGQDNNRDAPVQAHRIHADEERRWNDAPSTYPCEDISNGLDHVTR